MAQFDLANHLISRIYVSLNFSTNGTGAISSNTGPIDTKDDESVNLFAGITAVIPSDPNTYNINISYSITESDYSSGPYTSVPAEKFVYRDSESPIRQIYSGGKIPGTENFTFKEIGLVNTKRFLKIQLNQSSSTTGDVQSANFSLFMINDAIVKPSLAIEN